MADYNELWYMKVESIIFDKIKKKSSEYLKKYKDITFTSDEVIQAPTKFPCVEIREIGGEEVGQTFEGDAVCGYRSTFQVTVYHNSSKQIARDVMEEIVSHFKQDLKFDLVAMPIHSYNGQIHTYIARCRRVIGAGDKI